MGSLFTLISGVVVRADRGLSPHDLPRYISNYQANNMFLLKVSRSIVKRCDLCRASLKRKENRLHLVSDLKVP